MFKAISESGKGVMAFLLFSFLFYFIWSCDDKNSNIIGPYKVIPKLNYYQPKVECIEVVSESTEGKGKYMIFSNSKIPEEVKHG